MPALSAPEVRRGLARALLDRLAAAAPTESGAPGQVVELGGVGRRDYVLGLLDGLAFLGAVQPTPDGLGAQAVSPQAGWLLRLLSDLIDTGAPLVADWDRAGLTEPDAMSHPFGRSTDLLAALDARRRELLPAAAPVREGEAAVAVISRGGPDGDAQVLMVYDEDARAWQLPGGRCDLGDATVEATLLRELSEELGLGRLQVPADLSLVSLPPLLATRPSPSYGLLTQTRLYPFLVDLHRWPDSGAAAARWLTLDELLAGRTEDGQSISADIVLRLAERGDLGERCAFAWCTGHAPAANDDSL